MLEYVNSHKSSYQKWANRKTSFCAALRTRLSWIICSSYCGAMAVSLWVPFQLVGLLKMPAADPHKQPEEEWFPPGGESGYMASFCGSVGFRGSAAGQTPVCSLRQPSPAPSHMYSGESGPIPPFYTWANGGPMRLGRPRSGLWSGPTLGSGGFCSYMDTWTASWRHVHPDRLGPQL